MRHRKEKLEEVRRRAKIDLFLLTSPQSVKSFSGYFFYFENGHSPFHVLPAAWISLDRSTSFVVLADNELSQATQIHNGIVVRPYSSYRFKTPLDFTNEFLRELTNTLTQCNVDEVRIGIEPNSLPVVVQKFLLRKFPKARLVDVTSDVAAIRIVKDADEIENIRFTTNLCDIGQLALSMKATAGITELELFSLVRSKIESSAGTRVPMMIDFVSGRNTATGGGLPTNRVIEPNDIILFDLVPCLNGYWSDSCNTIIVGSPRHQQQKVLVQVKEALEIGTNAVRPGIKARKVDELMRNHIGNYPHHSGHGVGTMYHEEPRITPYNEMELLPGMVIALEPAVYTNDFGVRLEHLLLVTDTGSELISQFKHTHD